MKYPTFYKLWEKIICNFNMEFLSLLFPSSNRAGEVFSCGQFSIQDTFTTSQCLFSQILNFNIKTSPHFSQFQGLGCDFVTYSKCQRAC